MPQNDTMGSVSRKDGRRPLLWVPAKAVGFRISVTHFTLYHFGTIRYQFFGKDRLSGQIAIRFLGRRTLRETR